MKCSKQSLPGLKSFKGSHMTILQSILTKIFFKKLDVLK